MSRNEMERRFNVDLGKYGYGLKGAAWSQADRLSVVSRAAESPESVLTWDRDHLDRTRRWEVLDDPVEEKRLSRNVVPVACEERPIVRDVVVKPPVGLRNRVATDRAGRHLDPADEVAPTRPALAGRDHRPSQAMA